MKGKGSRLREKGSPINEMGPSFKYIGTPIPAPRVPTRVKCPSMKRKDVPIPRARPRFGTQRSAPLARRRVDRTDRPHGDGKRRKA